MKLINTMLVGVFAFSMLFAQPPTGGQNPPPGGQGGPGGDMDHKSAAEHYMMAVQEGMDRGVLDANDQQYLMGMVQKMKAAVDSEYKDGTDGAAGEVMYEFEEWLNGLIDEGGESAKVADRLAMELCMVESEAHRMNDPDGDHDDTNECHRGPHPAEAAFIEAMDSGASPEDAFAAANQAALQFEQEMQGDDFNQADFDQASGAAQAAFNQAMAQGADPMQAMGSAMGAAYGDDHDGDDHDGDDHDGDDHDGDDYDDRYQDVGDGPMGPNFDEANCMALEHNSSVFWVDHNQNGEKDALTMDDVAGTDYDGEPWKSPDYEGPYGTYHEYEDGTPVDCGGGNHQGDHDGDEHYDNLGGDTYWADQAYQVDGNQEHYDIVMSLPENQREKAYNDIKEDVRKHKEGGDDDHDGDRGPKFEDIDANGDGLISREEARAVFGRDEEGNDNPNFDDDYNNVDKNGDGMVDPNEHMMAVSRDDKGGNDGNRQGGPSQAVVEAWMSGAQGGGFDFDAAFDAAEAQAKEEAQAEGTYFGDDAWNECANAGRAAMQEARDDNKSPREVFRYVVQAVNACGEAQAAANQD